MAPVIIGVAGSVVIGVLSEAASSSSGGATYGVAALVSAVSVLVGTILAGLTKMLLALRQPDRIPSTRRGRAKVRRDLLRQLAQIEALDDIDGEEG